MFSVLRLLEGPGGAQPTVDRPIDHLVACHSRIEERLQTIERAVANLEEKPQAAREALAAVFRYFESSGAMHTEDEERSVFPRIEQRLAPDERRYIADLERQHREAEELYEQLKEVPPAGAGAALYQDLAAQFCELYRSHIASENDRFVAIAGRLLNEGDLAEISREMRARRGWLR
jgi:hemerythrin-like domain-containing protein